MVDKSVIDRMMENLKTYVAQLERLSRLGREEFLSDPVNLAVRSITS